jgi:hypothetical protein
VLALLMICELAFAGNFRTVEGTSAIPGDVNGDNVVNILDISTVSVALRSTPVDSRWNKSADLNNDAVIDLLDLTVVAVHYGETGGAQNEGTVLAGWRSSPYGFQQEAKPAYWVDAARNMSSKINDSIPSGVWILGEKLDHQCRLTFPSSKAYSNVVFSKVDENEDYLNAFDAAGLRVWLQVEPADADVETLIDLVLGPYHRHSCVVGFGIDVEWLEAETYSDGRPVTNEEAQRWLSKVKSYDSGYKLFLKHWLVEKMPTAYVADIVFVDDSQEYRSKYGLVDDFKQWGRHFSRSEVCFQIGYESDMEWWSKLTDPYQTISDALIDEIPNCKGIYWVDFTMQTVYPLPLS